MIDAGGGSSLAAKSTSIFLQIVEHPDGTITRPYVPQIPPSDLNAAAAADAVRSRDLPLNSTSKISLRLYLPSLPPSSSPKLPILLFFHGGGFVLFNSASAPYHLFCEQMAQSLPCLVLSLDYRVAPDHRLPAAYDDALEAVLWLRSQAVADFSARDPWLAAHADFDRLFISGSSSGANIALRTALRSANIDLRPLDISGVILNQLYVGGEERTPSEAASEEDVILPLYANDLLWRLALPLGANRDHEYSNLAVGMTVEQMSRMPATCLVKCLTGDPLVDRQRELVRVMVEAGVSVVEQVEDGGFHAMELFDGAAAEKLFADLKQFVNA